MIPFIRSLSELKAITESRDSKKELIKNESYSPERGSGQRKRYGRSLVKKEIELPNLSKAIRYKWMKNKESVLRFINDLDYSNEIQSTYDLTLIERQNKRTQQDVA
tara:strand:- start:740 stop:1057 length:318 start_codon:yes stop_codon:yes gene_type:complete